MILLHVSTKGWHYADVHSSVWPFYVLLHSVSRIGVCCFVMISGALFLGNERGKSISQIYIKNIRRIVLLILTWSIIYFAFRIINGELQIRGIRSVGSNLIYGIYGCLLVSMQLRHC